MNTERINDPVPSSLDLLDESNIPQEHSDDNSEDENDTSLIAEEALQEDFENVKKEEEVKELLKEQENAIGAIESQIEGQQNILEFIKKSKNELESHLLEAMKEEYHKKIVALESELVRLQEEKNQKMMGQ